MSLLEVDEPRYAEMQKVVELYVENVNPTEIARTLGIRRVDVLAHIDEFRKSAVNMEVMKDRVEELIASMDTHFSVLIRKAYEVIAEVDTPREQGKKETMTRSQMLSQKMNAIKTIADLESKRIDILQKSGLLEAADMGDQLAEMEEEMERVMDLLDSVLCDSCRTKVMGTLAEQNNSVVVVNE